MYRFAGIVALFCCVCLYAALANEVYMGTVTAGASTARTNAQSLQVDAGIADAGFTIPSLSLLSIQCSDTAYVVVGPNSSTTASAANGIILSSNQLLTSSAPQAQTSSGAYVSVLAGITDGGTVNCKVFSRKGNE